MLAEALKGECADRGKGPLIEENNLNFVRVENKKMVKFILPLLLD